MSIQNLSMIIYNYLKISICIYVMYLQFTKPMNIYSYLFIAIYIYLHLSNLSISIYVFLFLSICTYKIFDILYVYIYNYLSIFIYIYLYLFLSISIYSSFSMLCVLIHIDTCSVNCSREKAGSFFEGYEMSHRILQAPL